LSTFRLIFGTLARMAAWRSASIIIVSLAVAAVARSAPTAPASAFRLDPTVDTDGTEAVGDLEWSPRMVLVALGPPTFSGEPKVSGRWSFRGADGAVFTLYEWKSTALSADGCGLAPRRFWLSDRPAELHLGGKQDVGRFRTWLKAHLAAQARKLSAEHYRALGKALEDYHGGKLPLTALRRKAKQLRVSWHPERYGPRQLKSPRWQGGAAEQRSLARWQTAKDRLCPGEERGARYSYPADDPRSILDEVLTMLNDATKEVSTADGAAMSTFLGAAPGSEEQAWQVWHAYWKTRRGR
jgi:hypothetical protein